MKATQSAEEGRIEGQIGAEQQRYEQWPGRVERSRRSGRSSSPSRPCRQKKARPKYRRARSRHLGLRSRVRGRSGISANQASGQKPSIGEGNGEQQARKEPPARYCAGSSYFAAFCSCIHLRSPSFMLLLRVESADHGKGRLRLRRPGPVVGPGLAGGGPGRAGTGFCGDAVSSAPPGMLPR